MADDPPIQPGGGGVLGFSLAAKGKPRAKVAVQEREHGEQRQLITAIEGSRIRAAEPEAGPAGPRVIPGLANTYRAGVGKGGAGGGFVPSFVPASSEDALVSTNQDRFVAAPQDDGTVARMTGYGLQRMGGGVRGGGAAAAAEAAPGAEQAGGQPQPQQQQQQQQQQQPSEEDRQQHKSQQQQGGEVPAGRGAANGAARAANGEPPAFLQGRAGAGAGAAGPARGGDKASLMEELAALPDAAGEDAYEATPVEDFAKALLRGLGWRDGEGVGRSRAAVEVRQIVARPERLGLGADPAALPDHLKKPRVVRMGDKPKRDLVAAPGPDGRPRHRVGLDEALVPREATLRGPRPGKQMRVIAGRHTGLAAVVREVLPKQEGQPDRAMVRLLPSNVDVEVPCSELGEPGESPPPGAGGGGDSEGRRDEARRGGAHVEWDRTRERGCPDDRGRGERPSSRGGGGGGGREERMTSGPAGDGSGGKRERRGGSRSRSRDRVGDAKRHRGNEGHRERQHDGGEREHHRSVRSSKRYKHHSSKRGRRRRSDRSSSSRSDSSGSDSSGGQPPPAPSRHVARPTWLFPSIRVRVLDKALRGGALYLKKGVVVDVHPGALADVALDSPRGVVAQLPERRLETVVPREPGRSIRVVAGEWRGRLGRLLQAARGGGGDGGSGGGAAAVQLAGDMAIVRLPLDDVAEHVGPVDDDEDP